MVPLINGLAYDYTQIICNMLGKPVAGITAISWDETQEKAFNQGAGEYVTSFGKGVKVCTASITLSMNEVEGIRDIAPNRSLNDIPFFDIVITYGNIQKVVTHVLKNCQFTKDGMNANLGDKDLQMQFDLICSHIIKKN